MERKVLNAERIKNKGIKPENLRCSLRSCPEDELLFDIYDCTKVLFVGELRIVNASATFAGKAFKPVEIWLCCDDPLATYDANICRRIFISQPMNGRSEENILKERDEIANMLKKEYGDVLIIDSYIKNSPHVANSSLWCLGKSIELLSTADMAYFARGWECARGCTIEFLCARKYGIQTIEAEKDHCYPADIFGY